MPILVLSIILSLAFTAPIYADQLQIDSNSIHLQTEQLTPLPTQPSKNNHSPIVEKRDDLEHYPPSPISLSLSPDTLLFEPLAPTNPLLRNTTVLIAGQAASLFIYATQPLETNTKNSIPSTSCDNGQCDATTADIWNNNLTFGFGYRCEDIDSPACDTSFIDPENYLNVSQSISGKPAFALQHTNKETAKAQIIYKINIPASQQAGIYSSTIEYVLIPSL